MRISDWSSDVCSSDLAPRSREAAGGCRHARHHLDGDAAALQIVDLFSAAPGIERIAALEAHDAAAGQRLLGHQPVDFVLAQGMPRRRSEEHTSELQSLMRTSYAVFCLKKKTSRQTPEDKRHD